jgi:hypothetical protein
VYDPCKTISSPEGVAVNGDSFTIQRLLDELGSDPFCISDTSTTASSERSSMKMTSAQLSPQARQLWLKIQMAKSRAEIFALISTKAAAFRVEMVRMKVVDAKADNYFDDVLWDEAVERIKNTQTGAKR